MVRRICLACLLVAIAAVCPALAQSDVPPLESVQLNPQLPTDQDEVSLLIRSGIGPGCSYLDFPEQAPPPSLAISPMPIVVRATIEFIVVLCPGGATLQHEVRLGKLAPGAYVAQVYAEDTLLHQVHFTVTGESEELTLHNGQFVAVAEWLGGPSIGQTLKAVAQGKESGYFWSFGSSNVEATLKILDGTAVNGHTWVFLAPMTSLGLEVTVYDRRSGCDVPACPHETFTLEPGQPDTIFDVNAFPSPP